MAKIKVLLVEDEPTLAMIIKDTLDGEEFDIVLAADGEEGLALYKEVKPDIIVTDIMMPKIDGFTLIRHIRKTDSHRPKGRAGHLSSVIHDPCFRKDV